MVSLEEQVGGPARQWLFLALTSVALIVLIASVNVGILFLIRATIRAPELATRTALGAPAFGITLSVLLEGIILAVAAAIVGLVASIWGLELVKASMPAELPARVLTIRIDTRVVSVSLACAVVCGLLCARVAAWHSACADPTSLMKDHDNHIIGVSRSNRLLAYLVVIEVTSTCVLLVATLLTVTSFRVITTMDLGFERNNIMTIGYERPFRAPTSLMGRAEAAAFRSHLLERARSVRGVTDAAISTTGTAPMSGGSVRYSIVVPGFGQTDQDDMLEMRAVTAEYFRVMGMQLVRGRMFEPADRAGSPPVMLINDVAASRFFAGRNPIGQTVNFRGPTTIIGVLRGVRFCGPEAEIRPEMYVPADQEPLREGIESGTLFLRTGSNPREIEAAVRDALRPMLGGQEPGQTRVVDDLFRRSTAARRFNATIMGALGMIAIVLCGAGVYGTMAFLVASQGPTMGLRLALGASRWQVIRSVLSRALSVVAIGIAPGVAIAWHSSRAFEPLAFGVTPSEPWIHVGVASFVAGIGVLGALGPALHASRLDPLVALRRR